MTTVTVIPFLLKKCYVILSGLEYLDLLKGLAQLMVTLSTAQVRVAFGSAGIRLSTVLEGMYEQYQWLIGINALFCEGRFIACNILPKKESSNFDEACAALITQTILTDCQKDVKQLLGHTLH